MCFRNYNGHKGDSGETDMRLYIMSAIIRKGNSNDDVQQLVVESSAQQGQARHNIKHHSGCTHPQSHYMQSLLVRIVNELCVIDHTRPITLHIIVKDGPYNRSWYYGSRCLAGRLPLHNLPFGIGRHR